MYRYTLVILFSFLFVIGFSQTTQSGSVSQEKEMEQGDIIPSMSAFYAFELAAGDLSNRFGFNHKIGAAFSLKLKKNWVLTFEVGYMFGQDLKKEAYSVLDPLKTKNGQITSKYGTPGSILLGERGYTLMFKGGKILPFLQTNKNSGPMLQGGIGFLQHKIRIDNAGNDTPQVSDDYKNGYDRLTNGIAFSEFIGYRHYANNKMSNFYIGIEWTQALTQNRRAYNYDSMEYDNIKRLDMLYSVKAGIVIPFSRRAPKEFYAY